MKNADSITQFLVSMVLCMALSSCHNAGYVAQMQQPGDCDKVQVCQLAADTATSPVASESTTRESTIQSAECPNVHSSATQQRRSGSGVSEVSAALLLDQKLLSDEEVAQKDTEHGALESLAGEELHSVQIHTVAPGTNLEVEELGKEAAGEIVFPPRTQGLEALNAEDASNWPGVTIDESMQPLRLEVREEESKIDEHTPEEVSAAALDLIEERQCSPQLVSDCITILIVVVVVICCLKL